MRNEACQKFTLIPNDCGYTSIHQKTLLSEHFGKMVARVDLGCSIRNIRYQDTGKCGKVAVEIKINGDLMQAGENIPLPSHTKLGFPEKS